MADLSATAAARDLADREGIDLATLTPTGANGIVVPDVEAAIAARDQAAAEAPRLVLSGAASYKTMTPQGELTIRKGEGLPPSMIAGLPEADRALFTEAE